MAVCDIFEVFGWNVLIMDEKYGVGAGNILNALCEMPRRIGIGAAPCFCILGFLMRWQYTKDWPVSL